MDEQEATKTVLEEFKERMKISHSAEDDNLERLLSSSLIALNQSCGTFGYDNPQGKELVFERARYAYNDSLEFFANNFLTEITNLAISLLGSETSESAEEGSE